MTPFREHRWFVAAAGITLAFSAVSLVAHPSLALTAFADIAGLILMVTAMGITLTNAWRRPGQERSFWALMALGFSCWVTNRQPGRFGRPFFTVRSPTPSFLISS